jgi:hypothetical protein
MRGYVRYRDIKDRKSKVTRTFFGVTNFDGYWWKPDLQKWVNGKEYADAHNGRLGEASSHFNGCHSVRAFRRRLRQWGKYLPKGIKFVLCSRIDDYCVEGKIT